MTTALFFTLAVIILFVLALPVAGLIAAAMPTRANPWIAAACTLVAVGAAVIVGDMVWREATRTCPPQADQCAEHGGTGFWLMVLFGAVAVANVVPAVAAWWRRPRPSRLTASSSGRAWTSRRHRRQQDG